MQPLAARSGTPAYMAPELFREDGVHSTASDLWALGCVLYECRMGRPPFTSNLLHRLIEDIEQGDPAPLQGACPRPVACETMDAGEGATVGI